MDETTPGSPAPASRAECRLCGGQGRPKFRLAVLGSIPVDYFQCESCSSLQTETPHWLERAYSEGNLSALDTGAAQRNLDNLAVGLALARWLGLRNVIDLGAGDGLLCRMLRDREINCFARDKHAAPGYAKGFVDPDFDAPDLVLAFEVLEHFAHPAADLEELFGRRPAALLISTELYENQPGDWWYLAPESGQHVFFYSRKALDGVAHRYGYALIVRGGYLLFLRSGRFSAVRRRGARWLLKPRIRALLRVLALMAPTGGVWKDHLLQLERARARADSGP
jgi:hypothetical protein